MANGIPLNQGVTQTPTQPIPAPIAQATTTGSPVVAQSTRPEALPSLRPLQPSNESRAVKALQAAWLEKKAELFAGKYHMPDSEDPDTVNHLDWYESTGFKRPYPGEKKVRPASDFNNRHPPRVTTTTKTASPTVTALSHGRGLFFSEHQDFLNSKPSLFIIKGRLKIQSDTRVWLGTAYEHVPRSGPLQRLRVVHNRSGNQASHAGMTDSSPARPSHRNIARFRQFKQAGESRIPIGRKPAARE